MQTIVEKFQEFYSRYKKNKKIKTEGWVCGNNVLCSNCKL